MLLKKLILPIAVIAVLSGCGTAEEAAPASSDTSSTPAAQAAESTNEPSETAAVSTASDSEELSSQEKEDIKQYLTPYFDMMDVIANEMQELGTLPSQSTGWENMTNEEILAVIQPYQENIDNSLKNLQTHDFPEIRNSEIRKEVQFIRDHSLKLSNNASDVLQAMTIYLQTNDESYFDQTESIAEDINTTIVEILEETKVLVPKLQ